MTKSKKELMRLAKNERRRVARANARFNTMSKAQKRVKIAQDVIAQITAGKLHPGKGTWLLFGVIDDDGIGKEITRYVSGKTEVRDVIKEQTCTACALGSLFTCAVNLHDKLPVKNLFANRYMRADDTAKVSFSETDILYLKKFFTPYQLALIEAAFELGQESLFRYAGDQHPLFKHDNRRVHAYTFGRQYTDSANRLLAIMENIIENEGTFNP